MGYTREQVIHEILPAGQYPAKITEIELDEEGKFGPQFKFKFTLPPGENNKSRELTGWTSDVFSNHPSKLYEWVQAAVFDGGEIPKEYSFDSDGMLGKYVMLIVALETNDDGKKFNKIKTVLPYQQQSPVQPQPEF